MNSENDITSLIKVPVFDYTVYEENCGYEWQNWFRSFEWYVRSNHIKNDDEKFVKLMYLAGRKIQELYESLPDSESESHVVRGPLIQEHVLRQLHQGKGEKIDIFAMRLRRQAERCNFGCKIEENIKDQIIEKCNCIKLRRTLLKVGDGDLKEVMKAAKLFEAITEQEQTFTPNYKPEYDFNAVNLISKEPIIECNSCGFNGHRAFDEKCPAKGKSCNKCGGLDHFSRRCHSRKRGNSDKVEDLQNGIKKKNQEKSSNDYKYKPLETIKLI